MPVCVCVRGGGGGERGDSFQILELANYQTPSKFRLNYLSMVFLGRFHFWSGVILYQRLDYLHA